MVFTFFIYFLYYCSDFIVQRKYALTVKKHHIYLLETKGLFHLQVEGEIRRRDRFNLKF
jgi:hypothetical protein